MRRRKMKLNKEGMVVIELSELMHEHHNLIEHLDASGVCILNYGGDKQFYLVHPEVYEELELRLSLYQKAFEDLDDFAENEENDDYHNHS